MNDHREASGVAGAAGAGMAGHQRRRGVRPLVRGALRRAIRRRGVGDRRDQPRPPSTAEVAERQEAHAGVRSTWQIVAIEPQRRFAYRWHPFADRPGCRLRPGADHAGRVHPVRAARRRAADHHRVRIRRHPAGAPRRRRSRPTARAGRSRPRWCASTSKASGYERTARRRRAALRRAGRSQSAAHHRAALRSRPEFDIAGHQRHSGHPAGGQQALAAVGVGRAGDQQPAGPRASLDGADPTAGLGPATT